MNRREHLSLGIIGFVVYTFLILSIGRARVDLATLFWAFVASTAGSVFPDLLEAPGDWRHRGIIHSKRALRWTVMLLPITTLTTFLIFSFYIPSSFLLGYMIHLVSDATTRVGLTA